jgi:hypothetical protein
MGEFSVKLCHVMATVYSSLAIMLGNVRYFFVLRHLIADVETMLCCAGQRHKIH